MMPWNSAPCCRIVHCALRWMRRLDLLSMNGLSDAPGNPLRREPQIAAFAGFPRPFFFPFGFFVSAEAATLWAPLP